MLTNHLFDNYYRVGHSQCCNPNASGKLLAPFQKITNKCVDCCPQVTNVGPAGQCQRRVNSCDHKHGKKHSKKHKKHDTRRNRDHRHQSHRPVTQGCHNDVRYRRSAENIIACLSEVRAPQYDWGGY